MTRRRRITGTLVSGLVIALGLTVACTSSEPPATATPRPAADRPAAAAQPTPQGDNEGSAPAAAQPQPTQQVSGSEAAAAVVAAAEAAAAQADSISDEPRYRMFRSLAKDGIPAIFDPVFITVEEAASQMNDRDLVIGLSINGEHHAYSTAFLSSHEIVNDVVGGVPVAVTWCPLCFTSMVFGREIDGTALTFGVSGMLIMNNLVMYDRQTDTLWSQLIGEAVKGPLNGTKLTLIPSQLTSWGGWKKEHPDTLALDIGGPASDPYRDYYFTGGSGVLGKHHDDDRLEQKALVVGVVGESSQRAYSYRALSLDPIINDTFEGRPLVLSLNGTSASTAVYDRTVDGEVLTFAATQDLSQMIDLETESVWSQSSGKAVSGPLKGKQLGSVYAFTSFWFSWRDFYTETELYEP